MDQKKRLNYLSSIEESDSKILKNALPDMCFVCTPETWPDRLEENWSENNQYLMLAKLKNREEPKLFEKLLAAIKRHGVANHELPGVEAEKIMGNNIKQGSMIDRTFTTWKTNYH